VARLMAGANPTETHHLLQRSTLRQRVVSSCSHKGQYQEDAGTVLSDQFVFSHHSINIFSNRMVMRG